MADAKYNNIFIWGGQTKVRGPFPVARTQRETLPGVSGFRQYRLGVATWTWKVEGLLVATSLAALRVLLQDYAEGVNGGLYVFTDNAGQAWNDCELSDYGPASDIQFIAGEIDGIHSDGYCVRVQGTISWASPDV
jgi:hypothetical protein